jgi:hypothetical protein
VIEFTCPHCAKKYKAPSTLAGRRFSCHQCGARVAISQPKSLPAPEEEEILDVLPVEEEVLDVLPADRPPRKKNQKKRGLIFEGKNGTLELRGGELIIYHEGGMGYDILFDRRVRSGTYKHPVLSITDIEITPPALVFGEGILRFILGHERKDPKRGCPIIDEQAITFSFSQQAEVERFRLAVERMKRFLIEEGRMRRS